MWGGELSIKISAPQVLRYWIDSVLKILNKRITQLFFIYYIGVKRTAPATQGLSNKLLLIHNMSDINALDVRYYFITLWS